MFETVPFDYCPDGRWILCSDGSELLVHDGQTEGPLWSDQLPGPLVAVIARNSRILALDRLGNLRDYPADQIRPGQADPSHRVVEGEAFGSLGLAMVCSRRAERVAVLGADGLYVLDEALKPRKLASLQGSCLAISSDGSRLAVGSESGELRIFQADTGLLDARLVYEQAVQSVAWNPAGEWLAAVGDSLIGVSHEGRSQTDPVPLSEGAAECLVFNQDGRLVAWRAGDHQVLILHWPKRKMAGVVTWEREVGQLAFGPDPWLGIALAGGDGNKFNLLSGGIHRTDTFPHRQHNSWVLLPQIDSDLCSSGAGLDMPAGSGISRPASASSAGGSGPWKTVLGILLALVLLGLVGYLTLLKSEHKSEARWKSDLQKEIRADIKRSVDQAMGDGQ